VGGYSEEKSGGPGAGASLAAGQASMRYLKVSHFLMCPMAIYLSIRGARASPDAVPSAVLLI
jgi:hypothetical protein